MGKRQSSLAVRSSAAWDMQVQLAFGAQGERDLASLDSRLVIPENPPRAYDLVTRDGKTVEVKTDSREHTSGPNFFMEVASHGKPGGPWRTLMDRVDIFVYWFPGPTPLAYWFHDVASLVDKLNDHVLSGNRYVHQIRNKGYSAQGYTVPRAALIEQVNGVERLEYRRTE